MNNITQMKTQNEQLRREAKLKREKLSKTLQDMKNFMEEHKSEDYLIVGFSKKDQNPWFVIFSFLKILLFILIIN
jgi:hypothetical protein